MLEADVSERDLEFDSHIGSESEADLEFDIDFSALINNTEDKSSF